MLSESNVYAKILENSGFTISKATTLTSFICENNPHLHQSLAYGIDAHLEFMFKYDIFLNFNVYPTIKINWVNCLQYQPK